MLTSVRASNRFTARWCDSAGDSTFVVSGAGLWPLLGVLAAAAQGPARAELAAAVGVSADEAHTAALELIAVLRDGVATGAALGIWARDDVALQPDWVAGVPSGVVRRLDDQRALDDWVTVQTDGRVDRFPLTVTPADMLVLATALAAKTRWRQPFTPSGDDLFRSSADLDAVALLDDSVTRVVVEVADDLDVHLLIGNGAASSVLGTGFAALDGAIDMAAGSSFELGADGPGFTVHEADSATAADRLDLRVPAFHVLGSHDLLDRAELFGLAAASDPARARFPAMVDGPLAVSGGGQDVLAIFSAGGFEAAAVTALALARSSMPLRKHRIRCVDVRLDRSFGFLAVHRPTGLVVVAGWVAAD